MYFHSLHDLIYMNGLGGYVWSVYFVAVVIVGYLAIAPRVAKRRFFREQARRIRREQRASDAGLRTVEEVP